jgi:hypothetical protein
MQMIFLVREREQHGGRGTDRRTKQRGGGGVHAWPGDRCQKSYGKEGPTIWGVSVR